MPRRRLRSRRAPVLAVLLAASILVAPAASTAASAPETLLDFCTANPRLCAISVYSIDEGWERHLNPDRPQVLASTMKTVMLIAYAQAVVDGTLSPDETMTHEQWGRFQTLDGGALNNAWNALGQPQQVTWADLMRMMILHSDNSAPDQVIARLGNKRIDKTLRLIGGFHDRPAPISAMFGLFFNGNAVGGTGARIASDYGGFSVAAYADELEQLFADLGTAAGLRAYRQSLCVAPPWEAVTCNRPVPTTGSADAKEMLRNHFTRSTTRTYAGLMKGILEGTALPAAVEAVTRPALEVWLEVFPTLQTAFTRYGLKGGSLATAAGNDVLTWATYIENAGDRRRFAVAVFLQGISDVRNPPGAVDVQEFAQQFALSPGFRATVRDTLAADDARAELVPQIRSLKRKGRARQRAVKLTVKARVTNAAATTSPPTSVALYLSDDGEFDGRDELLKTANVPALKGNKGKNVTLRATLSSDPTDRFILLVVDGGNAANEQDETNNVLRQRIVSR